MPRLTVVARRRKNRESNQEEHSFSDSQEARKIVNLYLPCFVIAFLVDVHAEKIASAISSATRPGALRCSRDKRKIRRTVSVTPFTFASTFSFRYPPESSSAATFINPPA